MGNPEVKKIIDVVCEKYPGIDTVLFFGSANSPEWTPESDIDLFFIDDSLKDGKIDLSIENINVEIQTDNFAGVAECIKSEYGQLLNRNVSTMIATSKLVRNKSNKKIGDLKKSAKDTLNSPVNYSNKDVEMWRYSIIDYLGKAEKDLERSDMIAFYFDTYYVIQNATELVMAQKNQYFPQPKELASILRAIAPDFFKILQNFETATSAEKKMRILKKVSYLC